MIIVKENNFNLTTKNTSYLFRVNKTNHLEHIYYGNKVSEDVDFNALALKQEFSIGNGIAYDEKNQDITLESMLLETSSRGHGDIRNPMFDILLPNASRSLDLKYVSHLVRKHEEMKELPCSYGEVEDLVITLKDEQAKIQVDLIYTIYEKEDVITRRGVITNLNKEEVKVLRAFSLQLDLINKDYKFISFHGSWIREMERFDQPCVIGTMVSESLCGVSSSRSNPFIMLARNATSEDIGEVYGFNLIYSGNHLESVETDTYNHIRVLTGINPTTFDYTLKENERFETPEAIMTYSNLGFNGMSQHMHDFINNHITRGEWSNLPRPVLNNSWEAAYFNFNERKLIKMAKYAKKAGVELFVLDDGWFGNRNNDQEALGDWFDNLKKLPGGLSRLSKKINNLGLDFGLWVEPEMISEKSELYKKHPEWAIEIPSRHKSLGRHQMFLDLSNKEVVDYLIDTMSDVFTRSNVKYIKWDMNRIFSDYYSKTLDPKYMNEFSHRYYLGLYRLLRTLVERFPHVLFESCASGGNRFDLGMLCYMPQTWASDNSDPISRSRIQKGYSYGYPMNTLGCHVSPTPNHQTLRETTIDTRFNVAFLGCLGYEMSLKEISKKEFNEVKEQIEIYKKYRSSFLHSTYYRNESKDGISSISAVSEDKSKAVFLLVQETTNAGHQFDYLELKGLEEDSTYKIKSKDYNHPVSKFGSLVNQTLPFHISQRSLLYRVLSKIVKMKEKGVNLSLKGNALNNTKVPLNSAFAGTGFNENTRLMLDSDTRLVFVEKEDE